MAWRGDFLGIFVKRPGPIRTLHLIPWEDRVYAVSEEKMLEFINAVNSQLELDGRHYPLGYAFKGEAGSVRNPPKPRSPPLLPEKWRNHLLTRPIEARVLAVGRVQYRKRPYGAERFVPIKISAGSKQGLKAGHLLHIANFDRATPVNNFTVGEETSTGEAGEGQEWNPLETERLPALGRPSPPGPNTRRMGGKMKRFTWVALAVGLARGRRLGNEVRREDFWRAYRDRVQESADTAERAGHPAGTYIATRDSGNVAATLCASPSGEFYGAFTKGTPPIGLCAPAAGPPLSRGD